MKTPVLVWDLPTRVFHWTLALSFAGAWLTAESERLRDLHVTLGYTLLGLIAFRLVWGFAGPRYARFSAFVRGPAAIADYLGSLLAGHPQHHIGHNPAGGLAVVLLLALGVAASLSGWAVYEGIGGDWIEGAHELFSNAMLALVLVHIVAVLASSLVHRENLVRAMLTGYKRGEPGDGIRGTRPLVALVLLVAIAGYWGVELAVSPPSVARSGAAALAAGPAGDEARQHEEDDD